MLSEAMPEDVYKLLKGEGTNTRSNVARRVRGGPGAWMEGYGGFGSYVKSKTGNGEIPMKQFWMGTLKMGIR
jgi:hypothetical protein